MFVNTQEFRREALHFIKYGYYCTDLPGTPGHEQYWAEQLRRCKEGYSVAGTKITGDHYGYLNFAQIKLTDESNQELVTTAQKGRAGKKIVTFPSFWDGDYEYFHVVDIAENGILLPDYMKLGLQTRVKESDLAGGKHVCVGKSRRKGYSFKNGWKAANRYNTVRDSVTVIGAFDKKYLYPEGTMGMTSNYLNFLNENTGWAKRRLIDKQEHRKAGFIEYNAEGIPIEKGYKSQVIAVTFKDNPDAARGKDGSLILFEEAGKFPNLKDAVTATKPTLEDGIYTTGTMLVFGTGGKDADDWLGFNEIFYNPQPLNFISVENIWDEGAKGAFCSFFVPDYMNKPGYIDKDGNSDIAGAKQYEQEKRDMIAATSKDANDIASHSTEYPWCPREAFSLSLGNIFPVADLTQHLNTMQASKDAAYVGQLGEFTINDKGKVEFKEDFTGKMKAADYPVKESAKAKGAVQIWEHPPEGDIPHGLYIAGTDPYDQDQASNSMSLGSTFIYKVFMPGQNVFDFPVAEFTGRPDTAEQHHETVRRMLLYYNARDLYENEKNTLKMHFQHKNSLYLLTDTPTILKATANTSVNRGKGIHMTPEIKSELEIYTRDWLLTPRGEGRLNLHYIYSQPLLKELIAYNNEGNFDRVIAFMLCILNKLNNHNLRIKEVKKREVDPFFKRTYFK